jgi:hypothetical protein
LHACLHACMQCSVGAVGREDVAGSAWQYVTIIGVACQDACGGKGHSMAWPWHWPGSASVSCMQLCCDVQPKTWIGTGTNCTTRCQGKTARCGVCGYGGQLLLLLLLLLGPPCMHADWSKMHV